MIRVEKRLPNFLIVGAAKSGTTSLYNYLSGHPEILMSKVKEPKFFSYSVGVKSFNGIGDKGVENNIVKNLDDYMNLFKNTNYSAMGECSADNLYFAKKVITRMKDILEPNTKIIIILRNPIDRAYSAYSHLSGDARELLSFEEGLNKETYRINNGYEFIWYYKDVGLYYNQVKEYMNNFKFVKIYLFEDLIDKRNTLLEDIFDFLEVNKNYVPDNIDKIYNSSGVPKVKLLQKFLLRPKEIIPISILEIVKYISPMNLINKLRQNITKRNLTKVKMNDDTRVYLTEFYREDILKLQGLIKRDLGHWLSYEKETHG